MSRRTDKLGDDGGPRRGYVVGLTIFIDAKGQLGLFENSLRQNVRFLYQMFRAAPDCARVFLLNHGDGEPGAIPPCFRCFPWSKPPPCRAFAALLIRGSPGVTGELGWT